jgi:hypothetical protein
VARPEPPVEPGDVMRASPLGPCVGGVVRTYGESGSRLWSVNDGGLLQKVQGTGALARVRWAPTQTCEMGLLVEETGVLVLQSSRPHDVREDGYKLHGRVTTLQPPRDASLSARNDLEALLFRAMFTAATRRESLLIVPGEWGSDDVPFCRQALWREGENQIFSVVETAPAPARSGLWGPHIDRTADVQTIGVTLDAPKMNLATIPVMEAIGTWGCQPWDFVITFVRDDYKSFTSIDRT